MKSFLRITTCLAAATMIAAAMPAIAQERSAGNATDLQMTWSSLKSLVNSASTRTELVNSRIDQIVVCNKLFKLYAPGTAGADANGCIENALIKQLAMRMDAAESGIKDANDRITALDAKLTASIARIDGNIAALSSKIDGLTTRVTAAEGDIQGLNTTVALLSAKIADLNTKIDTVQAYLDGRITNLNAKVDANQADMNTKVGAVNDRITAEVKALNEQIASINAQIKDLYTRTNDLYNKTADLYAKTADVSNRVASIETCGRSNRIYNSNAGCVTPSASSAPSCSIDVRNMAAVRNHDDSGTPPPCPAGYNMTGDTGGSDFTVRICARVVCG